MATAPTVDALVQALRSASRPLDAAGQRLSGLPEVLSVTVGEPG
jgi:hypothetical protein